MTQPDDEFMMDMLGLEDAYLRSADPIVQSGFSGGSKRWITERQPLVDAVDRDGDFLDVGCANGLLAADVCRWAAESGFRLTPYGIDLGNELITLVRDRHSDYASNFQTVDAIGRRRCPHCGPLGATGKCVKRDVTPHTSS